MTEYYHTLVEKGGKVLRSYGDVVLETDYQILGHKDNEVQCPPEEKWIGWKTLPYPHPTFVRLTQEPNVRGEAGQTAPPALDTEPN